MTDQTTALRDRIAAALRTTRRTGYEGQADHGTHRYDARCALCAGDVDALTEALAAAVLPATTDQTADRAAIRAEVLNEQGPEDQETLADAAASYRWLRPVIEATMTDSDRWDGDESEEVHLGRYVQWLAAQAQAPVTEAQAERLATLTDCHGGTLHCEHYQEGDGDCCRCGRDNWCPNEGVAPAALRRVADETPAAETQADGAQRLCGKSRGVSGLYYQPCARAAGHKEAYCKSADGEHLFLAASPMDPVHILGIEAAEQPAAGARQDGADRPGLRERHRAAWAALTPEQQAARLAVFDQDDERQGGAQR